MNEFEKELDNILNLNNSGIVSYKVYTIARANFAKKYDKQLVVVPKFVAEWYNDSMDGTFSAVIASYAFNDNLESVKWVSQNGGMELLCKMYLYGYTVEKEKLYLLKNKLTNRYLMKHKLDFNLDFQESSSDADTPIWKTKFTQSEIDDMETGSYEQIDVAE